MQSELAQLLAGRHGHFRMESGLHSEWWYDLHALFADPARLQPYVADLAHRLRAYGIEAVCGPMTGGARLAEEIAAQLGATYLFTERFEPAEGEGFFRVKYRVPAELRAVARGKSVAIVDDAISAGSAARGTHADLIACGARPVVLGALFVFGDGIAGFAAEKNLPVEAITRMPFGMWKPAECPLCAAGIAVEKVSDAV
jgi:orotate phosphoribosyltransferase